MDVEKLESVYEWVTALNLSKPIQNFAKDFSDAVLMAEIIAQFLPRYVTLANFGHVNSLALKRYNWETLQKVVLRHLKFQLTFEQIEKLANAEQGVIEWVLWEIKTRIQDAIKERRFRPANRTVRPSTSSRSASTSRGYFIKIKKNFISAGSSSNLNILEDLKEQYANRNNKVSNPSTSNSPFDSEKKQYKIKYINTLFYRNGDKRSDTTPRLFNGPPPVLDCEFTNEELVQVNVKTCFKHFRKLIKR